MSIYEMLFPPTLTGCSLFIRRSMDEFYQGKSGSYAWSARFDLSGIGRGRRAGWFCRYITDDVETTFIGEIIVAKSHRRQGLGRHLIEEIEARLPATRIELVSEEDGFYKALGFSFVGNGFRLRKWNWRQTNEKNKDYISKSGKDSVR